MKKTLFILVLVLGINGLQAQKADFKSAEKFRSQNMAPKVGDLSVNANWIHETNRFWYSYKTSSGKNYYYVNADAKTRQPMFDSRYMAAEIHKLIHRPYNELDLPLKEIEFEKGSTSKFTFQVDSIRFIYDIGSRVLAIKDTVPKEKPDPRWASYSPDSTWIAFAKDHNLFLMKAGDADSVEIQLSFDGVLNYSYSMNQSDTAAGKRSRSRARWFENSEKLYIVRSDSRKVGDLFVINSLSNPRPELETYKYAMPGEENVPQQE